MNERLLYRPIEAAEIMAVSRARCYQLIGDGVIPSIKLGGSIRIPADALKAWVAQQPLQEPTTGRA